ncbi:MAG: hypothetical protein RR232_04985 [Clostridia bacterium]
MQNIKNKSGLMIAGIALVLVLLVSAYVFVIAPAHHFTIDVNPSISIETNRLGRVVSVTGINEDAQKLLENYNYASNELENVVEDISGLLIANGYLINGTGDVLVTVKQDGAAEENIQKLNACIAESLSKVGVAAKINSRVAEYSAEDVAMAEKYGVSVGKMLVLEYLAGGDEALLSQLTQMSIAELNEIAKAKGVDIDELSEESLTEPLTQEDINDMFEQDLDELDELDDLAEEEEDRLEQEAERLEEEADRLADEADRLKDEAEEEADRLKEEADKLEEEAEKLADEAEELADSAKDAADTDADETDGADDAEDND